MDKNSLEREALLDIIDKLKNMAGSAEKAPQDEMMSDEGQEMVSETENPTGDLPEEEGMLQKNNPNPSIVIGDDDKPPMRKRSMMSGDSGPGRHKVDLAAIMTKASRKR